MRQVVLLHRKAIIHGTDSFPVVLLQEISFFFRSNSKFKKCFEIVSHIKQLIFFLSSLLFFLNLRRFNAFIAFPRKPQYDSKGQFLIVALIFFIGALKTLNPDSENLNTIVVPDLKKQGKSTAGFHLKREKNFLA